MKKLKQTLKLKSLKITKFPPNPQNPVDHSNHTSKNQRSSKQFPFKITILPQKLPTLDPKTKKKNLTLLKRNSSLESLTRINDYPATFKRNKSLVDFQHTFKEWKKSDLPYTAENVLLYFNFSLTPYEKLEIQLFSEIYYIGLGVVKLIPNPRLKNNGFDDERSDLILIKSDHLLYRFEILDIIGKGTYGEVVKVYDHKEEKQVAAKVIRNVGCIKNQVKIEIRVLEELAKGSNENIIRLKERFEFRNHVIETFELLDLNFYELQDRYKSGMDLGVLRKYARQVLQGMDFYFSKGVIHCDLKPENIMLDAKNDKAVIIDFGSACFDDEKVFTYIQTRSYRAPEIILETGYNNKIDIWSLGCILVELSTNLTLFVEKNETSLFLSMIQVLDLPPISLINSSQKSSKFLKSLQSFLTKNNSSIPKRPLESILPQNSSFQSFIRSLLEWSPAKRPLPCEALNHPWMLEDL